MFELAKITRSEIAARFFENLGGVVNFSGTFYDSIVLSGKVGASTAGKALRENTSLETITAGSVGAVTASAKNAEGTKLSKKLPGTAASAACRKLREELDNQFAIETETVEA